MSSTKHLERPVIRRKDIAVCRASIQVNGREIANAFLKKNKDGVIMGLPPSVVEVRGYYRNKDERDYGGGMLVPA